MPKISIIIPVYKAEKYIHRCLNSIQVQTLTDFEVIIIDDGSPDRSGEICDEYAEKDSRFRVFHKENGGVATARQMGIDNAQGEYSIHADPDDWVEPDMLEKLYTKAKEEDADMVICDYWEEKDTRIYKKQQPEDFRPQTVLKQLISGTLHGATWNKLIRCSSIAACGVRFTPTMTYMEDTLFCSQLLLNNIRVGYCNKAFYHYDNIINENSLTGNCNGKVSKRAIDSMIMFADFFDKKLGADKFFHEALVWRKVWTKTHIFYSGYYSWRFLNNKYKEINPVIIKKSKNGEMPQARQLALSLRFYGVGNALVIIIKSIRKILSRVRKSNL